MQTMPVIMSFNICDPSGSTGIQADIETAGYLGCHCTPIVTALAQDIDTPPSTEPLASTLLIQQARNILQHIPISVFKIGMLCDVEHIFALSTMINDYPHVPLIVDPQLDYYGEEQPLDTITALRENLCSQATLVITQQSTARRLAPHADTVEACAQDLMSQGAEHVLLSKNDHKTLYGHHRELKQYQNDATDNSVRGLNCAFSASLCAYLAHGLDVPAAIREAQTYTSTALRNAYDIGLGGSIPRRCPSFNT